MNSKLISNGVFWKFLERIGVQGVQFILQVILARLLDPEHYGILSLMLIFTTLANVFVQNGFNTSLVQNKDVTEEDYSSVFWVSMAISAILYTIIFIMAPLIGKFYGMMDIVLPLRVLALVLIPGAFNSIQVAKASRELNFKKIFISNLAGIVISGIIGIVLAYKNAGIWALVIQYLLNIGITCIVMWFTVKWKPIFNINWIRIKILISFGWKLLVSSLIDTLYQDLSSLVIGKKYNEGILGYYNRGKQFPQFIINAVNGTVQSVMLPVMSSEQDNKMKVKAIARQSIKLSSYIVFPMMAGLAGVAEALVCCLLTEKWLPCVPYMQIFCFSLAFYPVHSCNLQAINAMGRSDIFLKLEIIKKTIGVLLLAVAIIYFDTPIVIAMTGIVTTFTSCIINAYPNKKLIDYSYKEQIGDILPSMLLSIIMGISVSLLSNLFVSVIVTLVFQIIIGVLLYVFMSIITKNDSFAYLYVIFRSYITKNSNKKGLL